MKSNLPLLYQSVFLWILNLYVLFTVGHFTATSVPYYLSIPTIIVLGLCQVVLTYAVRIVWSTVKDEQNS